MLPRRTLWTCDRILSRKGMDGRRRVDREEDAILVASLCENDRHAPCLDLDFPVTVDDDGAIRFAVSGVGECEWDDFELALIRTALVHDVSIAWDAERCDPFGPMYGTARIAFAAPYRLVPSSTPDHVHLYIDAEIEWKAFARLLKAMYEAGILQGGFAWNSIHRGMTMLLKPGLTKAGLAERGIAIETYEPDVDAAGSPDVPPATAEVVF